MGKFIFLFEVVFDLLKLNISGNNFVVSGGGVWYWGLNEVILSMYVF